MNYYLVNYKISAETSRIVLPLATSPDISLLKTQIATVRNTVYIDTVEIENYKEVTEDIFNLISPFINSDFEEKKA